MTEFHRYGGEERPGRIFTGLLVLGLVLVALASGARAAPGPQLSLSEEDGYGRMIFAFAGPIPGYRVSTNAGILVIGFDKPFNADLETFTRQMPRYVTMARLDGDRRTLRLALAADFWLDTKTAENSLYVDLMPPEWTAAAPPLPADVVNRIAAARDARRKAEDAALAAKAQGIVEPGVPVPDLSVRVVARDGITRLVFDWNRPVLYSLVQRQGLATITFDRTARVDLSDLRVNPPPYLSHASAVEHEGRLAVILTLKPGVLVNDFREDMSVVLDLKAKQEDGVVPQAKAAAAELIAMDARAGPGPKTILPQAAAPETQAEKEAVAGPSLSHEDEDGVDGERAASARAGIGANLLPEGMRPEGKAVVRIEPTRSGSDIVIDWPEPVGAAVFERADRLWIVFDSSLPLDLSGVTPPVAGFLGMPERVAVDGGTALVVPLHEPVLVGALEEGASWHISAGETLATTGRPVAISRNWQDDGRGNVIFDLKATRKILSFTDPQVRDTIMVATARGPVQAVQTPRSFVEFQALQTAQGVAIVPVADDVNVAAAPDNVIVSRSGGLTLSAGDRHDGENGTPEGVSVANVSAPAEMNFAAWRQAPGESFTARRQYFFARLAEAKSEDIARAQFDYGRFLLGFGLAPEAGATFDAAAAADASYMADPAFRAARGVARVLSGRYVEGIRDLSGDRLENAPQAAVWRGLARAELGHWEAAREQFGLAGAIADAFDTHLSVRFRVRAVDAALRGGDVQMAQHYAEGLHAGPEDRAGNGEILLAGARVADARGYAAEALKGYDLAIASGYPPVAAAARFGKAELQYKAGTLNEADFAKELDSLRFAWRGGFLELDVLTRLAALRLESGDIGEALKLMRVATSNYPDSDQAHRMNIRMSDIFADYFLSEAADKMPPVQALAFFDDFKDLTPVGRKGDEMIRHLAERLVDVDLLSQAEHLLDYQVANRLHGGIAKAQVAARLASIYLADQKPLQALAALRATRQNLLPEALAARRVLLEARALAETRQYDNALDLLETKTSDLANRLRADILWSGGRWAEAGPAIEVLLGTVWKANEPLSDDDRLLVMRGAIAYSLAGEEAGLSRFRAKFGEGMNASADAAAFAVVSEPVVQQGVAFREMAGRIASIDTLDRFLASLKAGEDVVALN